MSRLNVSFCNPWPRPAPFHGYIDGWPDTMHWSSIVRRQITTAAAITCALARASARSEPYLQERESHVCTHTRRRSLSVASVLSAASSESGQYLHCHPAPYDCVRDARLVSVSSVFHQWLHCLCPVTPASSHCCGSCRAVGKPLIHLHPCLSSTTTAQLPQRMCGLLIGVPPKIPRALLARLRH